MALAHCKSRPLTQKHSKDPLFLYVNTDINVIFTGSIARSANLPVFSLLRGGGDLGSSPPCQISPPSVQGQGCRTPKLKFLLRFDRNLEYKRPAEAYPLRDFHKIYRVCTPFQDALGVKIWLDLLKGL